MSPQRQSEPEIHLWPYVGAADREALISGTIAWLLDPRGSHALGSTVRNRVLDYADRPIDTESVTTISTEARDTGRRFDIVLSQEEQPVVVLEVKTKTFGYAKQLQRYNEEAEHVLRVGFGEWNWPKLSNSQRDTYPLVRLAKVAEAIKEEVAEEGPAWQDFLSTFAEYLIEEQAALSQLRSYFILEESDDRPMRPTLHSHSQRFVNELYWKWFQQRLEETDMLPGDWASKSQISGVWFANFKSPLVVGESESLSIANTSVELPGKFSFWLHFEIRDRRDLFAALDTIVGWFKIRVRGKHRAEGVGAELYRITRKHEAELQEAGWQLRGRRPRENGNFTLLTKPLRVDDFRASRIVKLAKPFVR